MRKSFEPSEVQLVVFYGPSGCGKTRLVQKLIYSQPSLYTHVVLHTSRKRRLYEVDGREMAFLTQEEMAAGVESGRFVACTKVSREQPRYGIARSSSVYDLGEKDSPNGEYFGIAHASLAEARNTEKPIVIINFNAEGAKQLKRAGVKAAYVLLYSSSADAGKDEVGADHKICVDQQDEASKALEELTHGMVGNVEQREAEDGDVEQAKLEWDLVPTLQLSTTAKSADLAELRRTVFFVEVLVHVQHVNLLQISGTKAGAVTAKPATLVPRNTKLSKSLHSEYGIILACAATNLNDSDPIHLLTLQTVYKKLTGNKVNCPRIGGHWQAVGFLSDDPADDLQGSGFLGLMQLLFFLDSAQTVSLAQVMHAQYEHASNRIPFCALSLRVTQIVLNVLKEERLSKECNRRDQVFQVINELYLGAMNRCYQLFKGKTQPKASPELSVLLVEVGRQATSNSGMKSLLKDGHTLVVDKLSVSKVATTASFDSFSQLEEFYH